MQIKGIKKKNKKYLIEFDDNSSIATYDEVILKNALLFNRKIDVEQLKKINIDTNFYQAYYKIINYISIRLRSEMEIDKYIDKLDIDLTNKKIIIDKLNQQNLIDDGKFAKAFVADKINLSNDGPLKIKKDLENHLVDKSIIEKELLLIDEEVIKNKIKKIIDKKIETIKYSGFKLKEKVVSYLISLGYDYNMILELYEGASVSKKGLIELEYEKLIKKLSIKYSGSELNLQIKKRLYQKGFSIDEINNII